MDRDLILQEVEKTHKKGTQVWGLIKHCLFYGKFTVRQISEAPFSYNAPNKIKQHVMNYFDQHKDFGLRLVDEWTKNPDTKTKFKEFFLQEV